MAYVKSKGAAGAYTVEDGATPAGAFKEPVGFREAITTMVGSSPFWQVSWAGGGQMPLRNVGGTRYVTIWAGDVRLPAEMSTISGPQRQYAGFIRSVPLSQVLNFVQDTSAAQAGRYFKAEHGVGATYVRLGGDGSYKVIDREHMGVFLTDEGRWNQTGAVITFSPKDSTKNSYEVTENEHNGKAFLAVTSADAAAGIVIGAEDINKDLDADPNHLPDHVLFKITAKIYNAETKENYPFHYISMSVITPAEECLGCPKIVVRGRLAPILSIFDCKSISGMTCRIKFQRGSTLPSRIAVQQLDNNGKLMGKKFLPYPNLKPEVKGWASFPIGSAKTVVLLGEWKGPWRSVY